MDLNIVLPVYNEVQNLKPIAEEIRESVSELDRSYQIVFVDDGSTDSSTEKLRELCERFSNVSSIHFRKNRGQSAAFAAGFQKTEGKLVITMDSDGQNDPSDIPRLLEHSEEVEVVVGYRRNRRDTLWKRFGSRVANSVRNWITGDNIVDTGCSLKLFQREVLEEIPTFDGMHRFLPTLAKMYGYEVVQIPVNHRARWEGSTKYSNLGRLKTTIADVLAVRWMQSRVINFEVEETHNLSDSSKK